MCGIRRDQIQRAPLLREHVYLVRDRPGQVFAMLWPGPGSLVPNPPAWEPIPQPLKGSIMHAGSPWEQGLCEAP